jgi:cell wall-associated NlpC family hydrolase
MADFSDLIGTPFARGGRDPAVALDCYGLVMECYRRAHGVELLDYRSPNEAHTIAAVIASQLPLWRPVAEGEPGSVALFRVLTYGQHVGFVIEGDRFIHTWERSGGVLIERFSTWRQRCMGCYRHHSA